MADLLVPALVLGLVTYGITMLVTAESLFVRTRARIGERLLGIADDPDYHRAWRIVAWKTEELIFCVRCLSYWVALVLVWTQVDDISLAETVLLAFAARTVHLTAWRIIDTNVEVVNR